MENEIGKPARARRRGFVQDEIRGLQTHHRESAWPGGFALRPHPRFPRKQTDVDYADNATLFVNHWEGEKFVEHEKLASIEHGCRRGNGYDATHHDLAERCFESRGQQTARR